jgi:ATP-dependent DNA ligase
LRPRLISEAALRNRNSSFVLDGEAVLLGVDGRSDFNGLHSRRHDHEVEFYAFDCLVSDGDDLRKLPLSMRKTNLARLLARRVDGIFLSDFEQGEIGPDLFRHACLLGLEGMVSKHRDSTYRGGKFRHWIVGKCLGARGKPISIGTLATFSRRFGGDDPDPPSPGPSPALSLPVHQSRGGPTPVAEPVQCADPWAVRSRRSKHRESAYRAGRFRHWIKVKNRQHPAFARVRDQF